MSNIRRKTAEHLSHAWNVIPHVTQHDKADITALEALRKQFAPQAEKAGGKLTMTAIALKIVAAALRKFPQFNSSIDVARNEIVYKKSIHVGVAADTERGLLVPVIRDVDRKGIFQLAAELGAASDKARAGKLSLDDMQGAGFTITNLGGIGGTGFTPIVNWPEVAILGISRGALEPVYVNGRFEPRLMLPLSLSYDHRVIDGADAARFLRWVAEAFEQPFVSLALTDDMRVDAWPRRARRAHRSMSASTQLVVIGAGPGGYAAAFYAADRGMKVSLVDPSPNPGGVCLYRGCIPSKALLHVAEVVNEAKHASAWGVTFAEPAIESTRCAPSRTRSSTQLTGGVGQVAKLRKIDYIQGTGGVPRCDVARHHQGRRRDVDARVRARDHRDRLASSDGARPLDRQPARDGFDRGARDARYPEIAARRRRRLYRPRARQRLRRARLEGHGRRDDRRPAARRRPRSREYPREAHQRDL